MRNFFLAALPMAAAWPAVMERPNEVMEELARRGINGANVEGQLEKRFTGREPKVPPPKFKSGRNNCGIHTCTDFSEDQLVDVSEGSGHEFQSPGSGDLRGQCPGLNAAANHGFLPRNGIQNIQQTIDGLAAAYQMSTDLSGGLAVLSIAICGDPIAQTWSIGGAHEGSLGLLGQPTGILGTHNRYEGDASIVRDDAYLAGGSVDHFNYQKWEYLYSIIGDNYGQDTAAKMAYWTAEYSVLNNPYYFSAPFSGLVAPDAHNFITAMMSNHTAEMPGGYMDKDLYKSFFAVTGEPGKFKHHKYQEQIPPNWYKRPASSPFTAVDTNADTVINNQIYPGVIKFGGNTGKVDSFAGIDFKDLTGGVMNGKDLASGNQLTCFFLQASQQSITDFGQPLVVPLQKMRKLLNKFLGPQAKKLNCPQLKEFNPSLFSKYPGSKYGGQK